MVINTPRTTSTVEFLEANNWKFTEYSSHHFRWEQYDSYGNVTYIEDCKSTERVLK